MKRDYLAHRLAWFYVHGIWPRVILDHVNGEPADNRLSNLREVTHAQSQMNKRTPKTNTSGVKGVYRSRGKWATNVRVAGRMVYFGSYDDLAQAKRVAEEAREKYHGIYANHGEHRAV
jgi:HNH endonuclease/AP2 domain